ncbi:MAG: hypothetical protein HYR84_03530, partial [Planctomycetes bacterium]|nr:hypothetical protein [Planctomycetota bacterium]
GANGPLAEAIKKMREVEKRLSQPDTGEETRKRQGEIVKDLDNLIQQIKNAQGQGQGKGQRMSRRVQQAGKPGDQQGQPGSPSNTGSGVGPQKPQKPLTAKAIVGDKNEWGHLPPELREEMMNVFKEQPLPKRERQISRYYESVSKKSLPPKE